MMRLLLLLLLCALATGCGEPAKKKRPPDDPKNPTLLPRPRELPPDKDG
jgi:hypothetical protein